MSDTPRTDAAEAAWERDGGGSIQRWTHLARQLERELTAAVDACASSREITWGRFKSWLVEGAPDRPTGIAAAKQITALNVRLDDVVAKSGASQPTKIVLKRATGVVKDTPS
jgi:hypothetical protein